jgi:hypothetical protein
LNFMRFSGKGFHDPTSAQRTILESRVVYPRTPIKVKHCV